MNVNGNVIATVIASGAVMKAIRSTCNDTTSVMTNITEVELTLTNHCDGGEGAETTADEKIETTAETLEMSDLRRVSAVKMVEMTEGTPETNDVTLAMIVGKTWMNAVA